MTIYYEGELLFDSGLVSNAGTYAVMFRLLDHITIL